MVIGGGVEKSDAVLIDSIFAPPLSSDHHR
jgi:hypothetical protein